MRLEVKEEVNERKLEKKSSVKKHWLGYFSIGCAAVLSLLILAGNILSAYGIKTAAIPAKPEKVEALAAEKTVDDDAEKPIVVSSSPS